MGFKDLQTIWTKQWKEKQLQTNRLLNSREWYRKVCVFFARTRSIRNKSELCSSTNTISHLYGDGWLKGVSSTRCGYLSRSFVRIYKMCPTTIKNGDEDEYETPESTICTTCRLPIICMMLMFAFVHTP